MTMKRLAAWGVAALALVAVGCNKPQGLVLQHLDPEAPAAAGLPARPAPDQPAPLTERPPFGLYAETPARDTLTALATGTSSPGDRFRAALTAQGAWVARVDGAWLWQIQLPDAAPAPGTPTVPAPPAKPDSEKPNVKPAPAAGPATVKSIEWTVRGTLLIQDSKGLWLEADPEHARVTALPAGLQGKEVVAFSPDGKQVLYYVNDKAGKQLWSANADGSKPTYLGVGLAWSWNEQGKLVVAKIAGPPIPPPPAPAGPPVPTPLTPIRRPVAPTPAPTPAPAPSAGPDGGQAPPNP
ncbi:MAG TPA: hypothetical protein VGK74_18845 [Symbiobacteriaceae bacterium]